MARDKRCPYFRGQSNGHKLYITCGENHHDSIRLDFDNVQERANWKRDYCRGDYESCPKRNVLVSIRQPPNDVA